MLKGLASKVLGSPTESHVSFRAVAVSTDISQWMISNAAFDSNSQVLALLSDDRPPIILGHNNCYTTREILRGERSVCTCFLPGYNRLAVLGDTCLYIVDITSESNFVRIPTTASLSCVAPLIGSPFFLIGRADGTICAFNSVSRSWSRWSVAIRELIAPVVSDSQRITDLQQLPNDPNAVLALHGSSFVVKFYICERRVSALFMAQLPMGNSIECCAVTPGGGFVLGGATTGDVFVWQEKDKRRDRTVPVTFVLELSKAVPNPKSVRFVSAFPSRVDGDKMPFSVLALVESSGLFFARCNFALRQCWLTQLNEVLCGVPSVIEDAWKLVCLSANCWAQVDVPLQLLVVAKKSAPPRLITLDWDVASGTCASFFVSALSRASSSGSGVGKGASVAAPTSVWMIPSLTPDLISGAQSRRAMWPSCGGGMSPSIFHESQTVSDSPYLIVRHDGRTVRLLSLYPAIDFVAENSFLSRVTDVTMVVDAVSAGSSLLIITGDTHPKLVISDLVTLSWDVHELVLSDESSGSGLNPNSHITSAHIFILPSRDSLLDPPQMCCILISDDCSIFLYSLSRRKFLYAAGSILPRLPLSWCVVQSSTSEAVDLLLAFADASLLVVSISTASINISGLTRFKTYVVPQALIPISTHAFKRSQIEIGEPPADECKIRSHGYWSTTSPILSGRDYIPIALPAACAIELTFGFSPAPSTSSSNLASVALLGACLEIIVALEITFTMELGFSLVVKCSTDYEFVSPAIPFEVRGAEMNITGVRVVRDLAGQSVSVGFLNDSAIVATHTYTVPHAKPDQMSLVQNGMLLRRLHTNWSCKRDPGQHLSFQETLFECECRILDAVTESICYGMLLWEVINTVGDDVEESSPRPEIIDSVTAQRVAVQSVGAVHLVTVPLSRELIPTATWKCEQSETLLQISPVYVAENCIAALLIRSFVLIACSDMSTTFKYTFATPVDALARFCLHSLFPATHVYIFGANLSMMHIVIDQCSKAESNTAPKEDVWDAPGLSRMRPFSTIDLPPLAASPDIDHAPKEQGLFKRLVSSTHSDILKRVTEILSPCESESFNTLTERVCASQASTEQERSELVANFRTHAPTRVRDRTTKQKAISETQQTMNENAQMLAERGEKISRVELKTREMEAEASNFHSMARAYRESQASKKWWQL